MSGHSIDAGQNGSGTTTPTHEADPGTPPSSGRPQATEGQAAPVRPSAPPAAAGNRFGSGAPLAPPRPGPSTAPPRRPLSAPPQHRASHAPPAATLDSTQAAPGAPSLAGEPTPSALSPERLLIAELRDHLDTAQRALAARAAEVRALLAQRDARISEVTALTRELASLKADHAREVAELASRIEEARARVLPTDDLQLIRGIGPAFARELARLGVRTFAQIAAWTSADIDRIAPLIKARPDRIRRDDWPKSAALLLAERGAASDGLGTTR